MTEEVGNSKSAGEVEDAWTDEGRATKLRLARCRGSGHKGNPKPEPTEPRDGKVEKGKRNGRLEKDRADQVKITTKTWADVVKGLKEDESKTTDSMKSWNESEPSDWIKEGDLDEPNHTKASCSRR